MSMVYLNTLRTAGSGPHIVIPYSYADHEFVCKLAGALRRDQVTPWIDEVDMSAGVFLVNRISQAARPVDVVIPVISASSVASSWVQHELRTAMTRSFNGRTVRVLPARIDDSALPDFLESQTCFDFRGSRWSLAYDELLVTVLRRIERMSARRPTTAGGPSRSSQLHRPSLRRRWGS
jgi:hypothetical protein